MTIDFAVIVSLPPSDSATAMVFGPVILPVPLTQATLFFLNRNSTPLVFSPTTLSLRACMVLRSRLTPSTLMPCTASACWVST